MATLREWAGEGLLGITMSSGFFSFFAHAGFMQAAQEAGLVPARLSGSSAGGLVAALWAAGARPSDVRRVLLRLRRSDFWDPGPGLGLLRGRAFRGLLADALPVARIEDCEIPLALSAFDCVSRRTLVIDRGDLVSAVHATCAFPLLFQPVRREGRLLADGGVADRPGLAGMPEGFRVLYHHIASRSPWRRRSSRALQIPDRPALRALRIHALPRLGPFRLQAGGQAIDRAYRATLEALAGSDADRVVDV